MAQGGMFFRSDLFEVQRRGLEEAADKDGFAYFMEQGLGKTRTIGYEFHEKVTRDLVDVLVIVCPKSLRGAWRDEFEEVGLPYPVVLLEKDKQCLNRINDYIKRKVKFALAFHYELVLTRGGEMLKFLMDAGLRIMLTLDESVRIKNSKSRNGDKLYLLANGKERIPKGKKTFQIIKSGEGATFKRILSGTPAPQGPHDLWMQFRFLGMMENTPYFQFRNTYCKMGGFQGKSVVGAQNLDILRMRTGPFAFRAKKKDWTDLPEKLWAHPREVDMTPEQRRAYLEIMNEFVLEIGPDEFITAEMAITIKNKLQQIGSGWIYDNEKRVHEIVPLDQNPKLGDLREFIENIDTKVLVFYYFKPTRAYLGQLAEAMGIGHVFLESGIKEAEFDKRKYAFNQDRGIQVAFCQSDAVREGHTLLGTEDRPCYTTYFLENNYSLYTRAQAEDRNHRHGQYNPVTYHDVVTSREDKAIIKALQRKAGLQEAVLAELTMYRETQ